MSIKEKLESLNEQDKRQLMYAFEHQIEQYIPLPDGNFIGVNVQNVPHLVITESTGVWATGEIKK
jgi:hypothetical protein